MTRLLCTLLVCLVASTGCALVPDEGAPESIAELLAARLSRHSLDDVPLTRDGDRHRYERLVAPLDDQPVRVSVQQVTSAQDSAEATLAWEWEVADRPWRYTSTARLVTDGDRWEVDWEPDVLQPRLRDGDRLGLLTLPAERGRILGQGDVPLVRDRPVLRYGVDKTQVSPRRVLQSARQVAAALDIDAATYVDRVQAAGPEAFVEALVLRIEDAREWVEPSYSSIPGAVVLESELPLAPTREFAAELLGRVGPATAEIIEESDGRVGVGDVVGLSGLQARYDEHLSGSDGAEVVAVGSDQTPRVLFRQRPRRGRDLRTTLGLRLQSKAENVLAAVGEDGPRSALVAIRSSDGSILAAANGPGNDGLNIATEGQYAPGSTFKVATALALLRAGVAPGDPLPCPATTEVDGRSFENYDDYPPGRLGDVSFRTAFAHSCNTALIRARHRLGPHDVRRAAAALGLGRDHDLGFPAYFGQVPPPTGPTEKAAALIGQGRVLASPMAMAAVAASVRAGRAVVPTLLPEYETAPASVERPLTRAESRTLTSMMRAVVTGGSARFLADVPGAVGAKTGTAEYGTPDESGRLRTHAWMIASRGDLAVAVFVETGDSGSATAGPLLEQFLR